MITVTVFHNVARDGDGRPTGMLDGYRPGDPVVRVFTYQADPAGRSPEEIAEEAFAIGNGHPRDADGEELARRYYERELRSLSFPGKTPCCPRSCCVRRSPVLSASPWTGYLGTASRVMVGLHGQAGAGMSRGMLAGRAGLARLDDAGFVGEDDGLDPVAQAELGEQVADV
jgi:hypothetical protein